MANLPLPSKPKWFMATQQGRELVCLSDAHFWLSHWDSDVGRSRRCGGSDCVLCAAGLRPVYRFVFLVEDRTHRDWWLELREAHRAAIESANCPSSGCCGAVFYVSRRGPGKRGRVVVDHIGIEPKQEIDCSVFVSSLGLPPLQAL